MKGSRCSGVLPADLIDHIKLSAERAMAASSPDSDLGSIDCFQNYTAPEVFVQGLAGQINQQDVEAIIRAQKQM